MFRPVSYEQPLRKYLTREQIQKIEEVELNNKSLDNTRNYFLLSAYTGLRYSDLANVKDSIIVSDGIKRIILSSHKTGEIISVKVTDKIQSFLDKIEELPTNQALNRFLKIIGKNDKVKIPDLHFHQARHSCATMLLSAGADLKTVSHILGHSSVKTTEIYAKIINIKADEAMDLLK